jgi:hypothetical protein
MASACAFCDEKLASANPAARADARIAMAAMMLRKANFCGLRAQGDIKSVDAVLASLNRQFSTNRLGIAVQITDKQVVDGVVRGDVAFMLWQEE